MQTVRGLARPWQWRELGAHPQVLWGVLPGRSQDSVFTHVRLDGLQPYCTCKTKSVPCAHALALLMLAAEFFDAFDHVYAAAAVPAWVRPSVMRADTPTALLQPVVFNSDGIEMDETVRLASAGRAMTILQQWLDDLMAGGFAATAYWPDSDWEAISGRLVDGNVPGAAAVVQEMAAVRGATVDWPERMLQLAGRLYLMIAAVERYAVSSVARRGDLHQSLEWPPLWNVHDEIADRWCVIATPITRRVSPAQRTWWLYGRNSHRLARVTVATKVAGEPQAQLLINSTLDGVVGFAQGTLPVDARILRAETIGFSSQTTSVGHSLADTNAAYSAVRSANPWLQAMPAIVRSVDVRRADNGWLLLDDAGQYLPLPPSFEHGWSLRSALDHVDAALFGLWDDICFTPVSVRVDGHWRELATMRKVK